MPVDFEPVRGGNLMLDRGVVQVVQPSNALRYVSHYATCPYAKKHRKADASEAQLSLMLGGKP